MCISVPSTRLGIGDSQYFVYDVRYNSYARLEILLKHINHGNLKS